MTEYGIPKQNLAALETRIAALNKRAAKLGVTPLVYTRTGGEWTQVPYGYSWGMSKMGNENAGFDPYEVTEVDLTGGRIGLPGWTFAGTIEHLHTGENVLRAVPGQHIPETYRMAVKACDHCGLDRNRVDTYIVVHDDGTTKQLGRTCIKDYLGHVEPGRLATWLENVWALLTEAGDPNGGLPRERATYRPDEIVAVAIGAIRHQHGYVKVGDDGINGPATKYVVGHWIMGGDPKRWLVKAGMDVTPEDFDEAVLMVEWAAAQGASNDYIANLAAYARAERVEDRAMGMLASLPVAYRRAQAPPPVPVQMPLAPKPASVVDAAALIEFLMRGGKKYPKVRFALHKPDGALTDKHGNKYDVISLSIAGPRASVPGSINVTDGLPYGENKWYGRVHTDGRAQVAGYIAEFLAEVSADVEGAVKTHGTVTDHCAFCGLKLEDDGSTDAGYGPVCAKRYGLAWKRGGVKVALA